MTPKQMLRIESKITVIKKALADEKRKLGGYDDSRGLRYLPTRYFVQLADYSGGLRYVNWFSKNFPDDIGFPDFLFECTIILYKSGKIQAAQKKALETFCSNTYVIDKFFNVPIIPINKWEGSNLESPSFTEYFQYNCNQDVLQDFAEWLKAFIATEQFIDFTNRFIKLNKDLNLENDPIKRHALIEQLTILEKSLL